MAGLGFFFRQTALGQLVKVGEDHNAALAHVFANALRPRYAPLIQAALRLNDDQLRDSPDVAAVHRAVIDSVRDTSVVRVTIYDLNGRAIYSSNPAQVGADRSRDPGFVAARGGNIQTALAMHERFEAFDRTLADRQVLDTHVPVRSPQANDIDAVFELHSDVTPFYDEIKRTQRNLRIGAAIVMILLYGALFLIVKRADIVIRNQAMQRERDQETITHLSLHDPLTDLPNRAAFEARLIAATARAKRNQKLAALIIIDLDGFRQLRDELGHAAGERILKAAAQRMRAVLREMDTIARLGGGEFSVLVEDLSDAVHAGPVAEKIMHAFTTPLLTEGDVDRFLTPTMGVALYPKDAETGTAVMSAANAALAAAKAAGLKTYKFYEAGAAAAP